MTRARDFADLAGSADAGGLTGRNLIINGAMQVAQRGTSSTGIGANSGYFVADRFLFGRENSGQAARVTLSQENVSSSDTPFTTDGHSKMLKVDVTTASGGISAGHAHYIMQRLEGQNVFHLAYGGSSAKSVTLSFWMKTDTKTGTMGVSLFHGGARTNVQEISLTTSWQKFELTYSGDTGDTFANDNSNEFSVAWALSAGSNFQVTANQWADGFDLSTSNQVDFTDNTSNNIYLTGVQLEVGEQATSFEHRSFGDELVRCQRYFYREVDDDGSMFSWVGFADSSTAAYLQHPHPVEMRAEPSMSTTGTAGDYSLRIGANTVGCSNVPSLSGSTKRVGHVQWRVSSGLTTGQAVVGKHDATDKYIDWSAEL